jgi:sec-independent protein translocase protein TatC
VGVIKPDQLRSFRRFGVVIIFVVAAIITPSADPISLFALALPMVVFYEISIVIGRTVVGRRAAAEA